MGYRLILTLEILVDMKHQLVLNTHAMTCHRPLDTCSYRHVSMSIDTNVGVPAEVMESMYSGRGVSLDWEEFHEQESVLARVELFTDHVTEEVSEDVAEEKHDDVIEETTAALHRLLDTPTKGFSQLVFNESVASSKHVKSLPQQENISEDELPDLSPIKHHQQSLHQHQSLDNNSGLESRHTTSTPDLDSSSDSKHQDLKTASEEGKHEDDSKTASDIKGMSEVAEEKTEDLINANNNVIDSISKIDLSPQNIHHKVNNYVLNLPSPSSKDALKMNSKDELNDSIDSEASSRSKLSSRQSESLSVANRVNTSGLFYGSTVLSGQQPAVCPFPSDWQFQTIPETIENEEEVD